MIDLPRIERGPHPPRVVRLGTTLACVCALSMVPAVASAQEAEAPEAEEAPAELEAAEEALPEPDPNEEEARRRFMQGVSFMASGDYTGAVAELEESYRLLPRANTLFNIAQCQERLFRYDLAIEAYQRYLAEAGPEAEDCATVERTLRSLGNVLGTLRVTSNVPAELWVGDRLVGEAPGEVLVPSGDHAIELRAEGYLPARREVHIVGRGVVEVAVSLEQPEQITIEHTTVRSSGPGPWLFSVGAGLTVVAAGFTVGFGVAAFLEYEELVRRNGVNGLVPLERDTYDSLALNSDIFLLTAGVLGIATTVVAFLTSWEGDPDESEPDGTSVRVQPWVGETGAGVGVGGSL